MLFATLLSLALLPGNDSRAAADDWPHLRGPALDGHARTSGVFEGEAFDLRVAWRAPLGPAYSGVAVSAGRAVTVFSDGDVDSVLALDADSGAVLWTRELGPTHRGHDGSEDGAISSPVLGDGRVFVLGPFGRLVALDAAEGRELWSVHLERDLGATPPDYGFTTTPLLEAGRLIVQVGGSEGRNLCAFDPASGELRWSMGEGKAGYQSPVAMDLAGRRQLVVLNGSELLGVAPEDGALLWQHALGERDFAGSGVAGAIDGERFYANLGGTYGAFRVTAADDGVSEAFRVEELYRSRELGRSYAAPICYAGHLYGFKSDFLTCVDAATGKRVWKSRPPGGQGLISVDDRLLVFGAEGVLAVVQASPEGYREEARIQALEHSSFTWPSFAGGRVFVRNSKELACVRIVERAAPVASTVASTAASAVPSSAAREPAGALAHFARALAAVEDKEAAVDAFLAQHETFPILEDDLVHFVFRGDVEDVAIAGSMTAGGPPDALQKIEGTDVYYATYAIEPGARWEYRFQVDFDEWRADPLNPRTSPALWGEEPMSEVVTAGYELETHYLAPDYVEPGRGLRGRLESFEYESEQLGNAREIQVYLPAGYGEGAASDERYPLLLVHQGPDWLERGGLAHTLDHVIGESVRPLVAAFIAPQPQWWFEGGGTGTEQYLEMLATELVPDLSERYRLSDAAEDRALMGTRNFALTAVYGALRHNDVFGKAAVQSAALGDVTRHALFELLESGSRAEASFYVDWNRYEAVNPDRGVDHGADSRRLAAALEAKGYPVAGGEALDGHGWGSWRSRTDELLEALFPLE